MAMGRARTGRASAAKEASARDRAQPTAERFTGSLSPIRTQDFGYDQARHLLWRAGFGGTPDQIEALASWGPERAVDYLLDVDAIPFESPGERDFESSIIRPPSEEERRQAAAARRAGDEDALARLRLMREQAERTDRRQAREVQKWWLRRMIETPRPLEEKMTLFWHGHFATSYRTIEDSYHMFVQNQTFRKHAVGNYGELLFQIIRDPAMLAYLDNDDSRRGRPNENLAREIMELFSLGVGNYTEMDIREGARALTGYTFQDDEFVFRENDHDDGAKRILGRSGNMNGDDFVRAILEQRACARYMSYRLHRFFCGEDLPSDESEDGRAVRQAVDNLASTMLASRYDLKPTLRRLFLSEHFYHERVRNQQIKSPAMLVVGAIRSLLTPTRDLSILLDAMDLMGQNVLFPPSVKGWNGGRSWVNTSTLFVRQNILCFLLTGRMPRGYEAMAQTNRYDPSPLLSAMASADPGSERNPTRVVEYLLRFALGASSPHTRGPVLEFVERHGGRITPEVVTGILLLVSSMPEYQLC